MRFRAVDVASATGGQLHGPDVEIEGVSFDSRSLQPGQLFVPIVADRDGHEFIPNALARGAAAYLTDRAPAGGTAIQVPDTVRALMALAAVQRQDFDGTVIGITGSVGKTSTKDFARAALSASKATWANERSFNNEQGLPTAILNTPALIDVLVLEMGMRGFGEIADLCRIAQPTIGVVTLVAEAHGDRVGGIDGVARAKSELIAALPADGVAILNADDSRTLAMRSVSSASVILFGESAAADVRITELHLDDLARASFELDSPWGQCEVQLGVTGRHMALNAAAALACVGAVGGDLAAGAAALATAGLSSMRMEVVHAQSGALVLNDAYNANPTSMRAALNALAQLPANRRVAVLGLMAEIPNAAEEHRAILQYAHSLGLDVIAYGTDLYGIAPASDPVAALGSLASGIAVLVKASRVVGLERLVADLVR
ncbi:MAG: UDP-N-acetylmuramoyl-tripeptide--D-alanyl-D-alanine ligase [Actinomycetia bacterium]|nr:UDP-N-acetylmuramoyl-tripeptide--D-alanyl-D-alanine ligase [Actinomycetes bacterium]